MAFRPALIASIAVTPEPPNGSRTISPGFEYRWMYCETTLCGFLAQYLWIRYMGV